MWLLQALNLTMLILAVQLLVGLAVLALAGRVVRARRQRQIVCARARRDLARSVPFACAGLVTASVLELFYPDRTGVAVEPAAFLFPGLLTISGAGLAVGCWLALGAARLEARGRLRAARAQMRFAGKTTSIASVLVLAVVLAVWLLAFPPPRGASVVERYAIPLGGLGIAVTGCVVFLAGLARKPRPSAQLAAWIYAGSLFLLAAAHARAAATLGPVFSWFG